MIGQSSFSSVAAGITPTALSLAGGKLFVTDKGQRVLSYDVSTLVESLGETDRNRPASRSPCCLDSPIVGRTQSVISGVSRVSTFANSVAIADPASHRVLLWRDSRSAGAASGPDVILGSGTEAGTPVSAATLVEPVSVALDGHRLFVGDAALHRVLIWNSLPTSGAQPADVVLGQPDMNSYSDKAPAPGRIATPVRPRSRMARICSSRMLQLIACWFLHLRSFRCPRSRS